MTTTPIFIRVPCPDCGDVAAPIDTAVITTHGTERRCTFICPDCSVPAASRVLTDDLIDALEEEGVPSVVLPLRTLPEKANRRILPPDVIKFIIDLASTDHLAGAE